MPFERMGLGATLGLDSRQAVRSSQKARDEFGRFIKTAKAGPATFGRFGLSMDSMAMRARKAAMGMRQIGGAVRNLTLAMAPMSIAMGVGAKSAMDFEQQMAGVSAITRASAKDEADHAQNMTMLTEKARELGIESVFSATQSGEAMEYMARAGFSAKEIVEGLGGVMAAAAAEGIGLATTTDIVASSVRGFGLAANDAAKIADVLALTSARTNTNIIGLGEGLKYVSPIARGMGVTFEETAATLGLLADSGLKGTLAGTAMKNALLKLAAPTGKSAEALAKLGLKVADAHGNFVGMASILEQLRVGLNKQGGAVNRTAVAAKLFGLRGVALTNLLGRLDKATSGSALTFGELLGQLQNAGGAAQRMADIRLATLTGALTLLKSSLEGVGIAVFGPMLETVTRTVREMTFGLNNVLFAIQALEKSSGDTKAAMEKYGYTAVTIAEGVRLAIDDIKLAFGRVVFWVKLLGHELENALGRDTLRRFSRLGVLFAVGAGAATPLLVALGGIAFLISGVLIPAVAGLGTVLAATLWPAVVAVGAVYLAYSLLRRENESFFDTAKRVWGGVKVRAIDTYQNAILPFWFGFKNLIIPIVDELAVVWRDTMTELKGLWGDTIGVFMDGTNDFDINWRKVGGVVASVIGTIIVTTAELVRGAIGAFRDIVQGAKLLYRAYQTVTDVIVETMMAIGTTFIDMLLTPIQLVVGQIVTLARVIPGIDAPPWMEAFAERGFRGLIPPSPPPIPEVKGPPARALEPTYRRERVAETVARAAARAKAAPAEAARKEERERTLTANIQSQLNVEGRELVVATAEHKRTLLERSGAKTTPWQRRMAAEQGLI